MYQCHSPVTRPIWLWAKNRYPKWNPCKRKHGLKAAVPWWFHFDPYPFDSDAEHRSSEQLTSRLRGQRSEAGPQGWPVSPNISRFRTTLGSRWFYFQRFRGFTFNDLEDTFQDVTMTSSGPARKSDADVCLWTENFQGSCPRSFAIQTK